MTVRPYIRINIVAQRTPHSTEYVLYIVKGKCGMPDISRARDDDKDNAAWASSIYIYRYVFTYVSSSNHDSCACTSMDDVPLVRT